MQKHHRLHAASREFQLTKLLAGQTLEEIVCDLCVVSPDQKPSHMALVFVG